ncbi:MAG: LysR family transcriptional regulator [Lachnospiraceae bacterium]|nr:LysR family transcriptional regulator [Lachnospiraceae bacterium]
MESTQLKYFLKVVEHMNITKAAEELCISQPSLSQTLKRLESEIGFPLFDRTGKNICLNDSGVVFYNAVKDINHIYSSALDEIREINHNLGSTLSLFVGCASMYLPSLLTYLKENTSDITFTVHQWEKGVSTDADTDLRIIASSTPLDDINAVLLLKEKILLAVPEGHSLTTKPSIKLEDLKYYDFIGLESGWALEQMVSDALSRKNFKPNVSIRVDNPTILRRLLSENLGIAFIPKLTWGAMKNSNLCLRTVDDFTTERYIYLYWNDGYRKHTVKKCIPLILSFFENTFSDSED